MLFIKVLPHDFPDFPALSWKHFIKPEGACQPVSISARQLVSLTAGQIVRLSTLKAERDC
jgi:hypothetical protein